LKTVRNSPEAQASRQVTAIDLDSVAHSVALLIQESPDLQAVIDAWPALPEAIKAGILAMVQAAGGITGQDR